MRFPNIEETIRNLPLKSAIIFREYNLAEQKRQELAVEIQKICKKFNHKLIIGKNFNLAKKIKADGYHFSDQDYVNIKSHDDSLKNYKRTWGDFVVSLACHSLNCAKKAAKTDIDLIFLSPIFPTKSHINAKTKGIFSLVRAKKLSSKPVFALGGINKQNLKQVHKLNIAGFAGIEIFQEN